MGGKIREGFRLQFGMLPMAYETVPIYSRRKVQWPTING